MKGLNLWLGFLNTAWSSGPADSKAIVFRPAFGRT